MHVGHFAVALLGERAEPRLSLGTLLMAAMLPDLLWTVFMLLGIEHVQFRPGKGAANYVASLNVPLSHSLLMDVVWGLVFAALYFLIRRGRLAALVLFVCVVSHWILDFISHGPDMPLAPGTSNYYGLGLWNSIPATLIVEGGMWLIGIVVYARTTRAKNLLGVLAFWIVIPILTLVWYGNIAGPPPPAGTAAIQSLIYFSLVVAWAYWINHLRPVKT